MLCFTVILSQYYEYILSYKARQQEKQYTSIVYILMAIKITSIQLYSGNL